MTSLKPYRGMAIIFGFYALGEFISSTLRLPIPGSVVGMLLLLLALFSGGIQIEWVESEAELFVKNMSIFFVPPGVGIVTYLTLIESQLLPISLALVVSFTVTLLITAKIVEVARK